MLLDRSTVLRLCRARDLLRDAASPAPPIPAIARAIGLSPFHFIRQFDAVFGLTPHQYRIESRLDRAKQLLAAGEHSVTEVCLEVGFTSLGSFSDLFARRIGSAPTVWQRRVRPRVQVPGTVPRALIPGCLSLLAHLPADAFRNSREA